MILTSSRTPGSSSTTRIVSDVGMSRVTLLDDLVLAEQFVYHTTFCPGQSSRIIDVTSLLSHTLPSNTPATVKRPCGGTCSRLEFACPPVLDRRTHSTWAWPGQKVVATFHVCGLRILTRHFRGLTGRGGNVAFSAPAHIASEMVVASLSDFITVARNLEVSSEAGQRHL